MYAYADVTNVHLEITSRCNAACPMCPRTDDGDRVSPTLPLTELRLADIQTIFSESFVRQLRSVVLCGNYGDPLGARDTVESIEYFRSCNSDLSLKMVTNGSGRAPAWWARLARVLSVCDFSIDGLEDTNALYRRGTYWDKIMESVRAYIGAGGRARWVFIVFRHNEHQVEEARALSRQLGFDEFVIRPTNRFGSGRPGDGGGSCNVRNADGEVLYQIKIPSKHAYRHDGRRQFSREIRTFDSHRSYRDQVPICCKAIEERQVYVSAEGLVFPCCWTAHLYPPPGMLTSTGVDKLLEQLPGGKDALNARLHPLRDIIEERFFQTLVPESWETGDGDKRLDVCIKSCGQFVLQDAPMLKSAE